MRWWRWHFVLSCIALSGLTIPPLDALAQDAPTFATAEEKAKYARKLRRAGLPFSVQALWKYYTYQGDLPLCAFYVEKSILEAYTGVTYPEDQLLGWYVLSGTYDVLGEGVPVEKLGEALRVKGLPFSKKQISIESLRSHLSQGHAVMAIVNPLYYWDAQDPMLDFYVDLQRRLGRTGANHVVWILDIRDETVFLHDTALRDGRAKKVPLPEFLRAWGASGNGSILVERPLPPLDPDNDGKVNLDHDGDGYAAGSHIDRDCDDQNPAVRPGAAEIPYNTIDEDCTGGDLDDQDGDGSTAREAGGDDCDDQNALSHPGAIDVPYDGIDTDCDGQGREFDADGDGHSVPADCDDRRSTVFPGAPELCDGTDNDCDQRIDQPAHSNNGPLPLFPDGDGDGYGVGLQPMFPCASRPPHFVQSGGDCNDNNRAVQPGAPEICNGIDDNCNGSTDEVEADAPPSVGQLCYPDTDGDGLGDPALSRRMCYCAGGWVGGMAGMFDCDDQNSGTCP